MQRTKRWLLAAALVVVPVGAICWLTVRAAHQDAVDRALYPAVDAGDTRKVRELLRDGANPNVRELSEPHPNNMLARIKQLIRPRNVHGSGPTALMAAARYGRAEVVDLLLKSGAEINAHDPTFGTALTCAASEGCSRIVIRLLRAGATPNNVKGGGFDPLQYAVDSCSGTAVRSLLDHGARFDPNSDYGLDVFSGALRNNHDPDVTTALLDHGVCPNAQIRASHLLTEAAAAGNAAAVRVLIDRGADMNVIRVGYGSPLHWIKASIRRLRNNCAQDKDLKGEIEVERLLMSLGAKDLPSYR